MSIYSTDSISNSIETVQNLSTFNIPEGFNVDQSANQPVNENVSLTVSNIQNGQATINYQTLPDSKPASFGYQVLIFQGADIPWSQGTPPAASFLFPNNNPTGSFVARASGIGVSEYIAVMQTNRNFYDSFAYSSTIPAVGGNSKEEHTLIQNVEVGANTVAVNFSTLPGNKPKTYQNWVAIWNAATPSFDGRGVTAFSFIPSDNPNGSVQLNTTLNRGSVYCVAYGTGANWGTISQYVTVTT